MTRIGIVGAGAASAAAAWALDRWLDDATITVFEKSGGLCGRAATRRNGDVTYDYGANYLKADDDRVVELVTETLDTDGLVDIGEPIHTFDGEGTVSPGRDADDHKWSYERGLTQIAKRLVGRTDAAVHRDTRVTAIDRDGDRWTVSIGSERRGPFDILLCNPPAPQTAALLAESDWDDPLRADLIDALEGVAFRTVWTAVLHYPFRIERPYYALVNTDEGHPIGWIAREQCKRGHVPDGESLLIVQASHDWSVAHWDDPPEENVAVLARMAGDVLGDERLATPDWTDHQGWRYAQPEDDPPRDLLRAAEDHAIYCLGDWTIGTPRLHGALRSGLDTADRVVASL
ncbi:NAD(P)/FAD-dependent oxidoreductase [Halococcoides cellulosivorans]|uniref:NAD/FAD-dependent oxidoreductase n=1 Tax=Halococcoides cellulosivorans TaxID=1679096 RepID=A0A2R4WZJ0_9EURY|nr:FAD-dependent oxidoreductase [Halococcoides cellulosivorans]AWB26966.1 NAD/FAD-dependent oxidoreductase [Halococcoides cellulosivorans]